MDSYKDYRYNTRTHKWVYDPHTEEEKKRLTMAIYFRDVELKRAQEELLAQGVCPHCHMILPKTSICDCQR